MNKHLICACIEEYGRVMLNPVQDETSIVETALFIEDVFHVTLTDEEICFANLGSLESIKTLIYKKLNKPK